MIGTRSGSSIEHQIPLSVLLLGWGGVVPFAGLALACALGAPSPFPRPETMLIGYGAVILSFMGGVHWGLAMQSTARQEERADAWHYTFSVVPALIGWAAMAFAPPTALILLSIAFLALLVVDVVWASGHVAPGWYGKLRLQLTSAVLLSLGLAWTAV